MQNFFSYAWVTESLKMYKRAYTRNERRNERCVLVWWVTRSPASNVCWGGTPPLWCYGEIWIWRFETVSRILLELFPPIVSGQRKSCWLSWVVPLSRFVLSSFPEPPFFPLLIPPEFPLYRKLKELRAQSRSSPVFYLYFLAPSQVRTKKNLYNIHLFFFWTGIIFLFLIYREVCSCIGIYYIKQIYNIAF